MQYIDTGGDFLGTIIGEGDLAIVWENAPAKAKSKPISCIADQEAIDFIKQFGDRLASCHCINPNQLPEGKSHAPVRDLRKRWAKVLLELPSTVKRILFIAPDANVLKTTIARPLASIPYFDLDACHGSIFTLPNGLELIPTYDKPIFHKRKFLERDIERFLNLAKPAGPLEYTDTLPSNVLDKVVIDLETTGLSVHNDTITAIGLQWSHNSRFICKDTNLFDYVISWLVRKAQEGSSFWFHNAAFDLSFLGSQFRSVAYSRCFDTLMRARSGGCIVSSLKHLGNYYTDRPGNYAWINLEGENHDFSDPAYLCEDLEVTWQLSEKWQNYCPPVVELAERCSTMLCEQTLNGTQIDIDAYKELEQSLPKSLMEMKQAILDTYEIELDETQEIKHRLSSKELDQLGSKLKSMGYSVTKTAKTQEWSLKKDLLREWGLEDLAVYFEQQKLLEAFSNKMGSLILPGNIMPHQQGMLNAKTGRTSMADFNWQQAPRKGPVRSIMISRFAVEVDDDS